MIDGMIGDVCVSTIHEMEIRLPCRTWFPPEDFEFSMSPVASATPADLQRYRDAGVHELYLTPVFHRQVRTAAEVTTLLEELARAWVEPAAAL